MTKEALASTIDHTVLKATATRQDVSLLCAEAKKYHFASVCVNPVWVPFAAGELAGTSVKVCTVIGFPLGANATTVKAFEAEHAVLCGAEEVDMVINVGALKNGEYDLVQDDISAVVKAAADAAKKATRQTQVKVIIETCYLTEEEKIAACIAAKKAGADFVKTSTGFGTPGKDCAGNQIPAGATVSDITLMRKTVDEAEPKDRRIQVKASGGIRDLKTALEMLEAGADRLGVSAGVAIVEALN